MDSSPSDMEQKGEDLDPIMLMGVKLSERAGPQQVYQQIDHFDPLSSTGKYTRQKCVERRSKIVDASARWYIGQTVALLHFTS